jgi:hypothetical protein
MNDKETAHELSGANQALVTAVDLASATLEALDVCQEELDKLALAAGEWCPRTYDLIRSLASAAREAHEELERSLAWKDDAIQGILDIQHQADLKAMKVI